MKQQDSFYTEKGGCFFFFLRALQAPSSTSPGQGTEQLSARGQGAARRQQCVNSSPYSGQGSARSSNHSQQQLNSPLQHTQTPSRLPSVTCCSLHPFLQLQKGEKKKKIKAAGFPGLNEQNPEQLPLEWCFPNTTSAWTTQGISSEGWGYAHPS